VLTTPLAFTLFHSHVLPSVASTFTLFHPHLSLFYLYTFFQIRDYFCIIEGEGKGKGREVKGKKKGKEKEGKGKGKEREGKEKGKGKEMEAALQICAVLCNSSCIMNPEAQKKKLCNWPFFMKKRVRKKA
jgi:hypothetical protein